MWDTLVDIQLRETIFLDFQTFSFLDFLLKGTSSFSGFRLSGLPAQRDFQLFRFPAFGQPFQPFELPAFGHIFVLLAFWTSRFMNLNLFRLPAQKALQLFALPAFQTSIFLGFQLKVATGILLFRQLINGIKTGGDILGIKTKGDIFMQYFKSVLLGQSFHD